MSFLFNILIAVGAALVLGVISGVCCALFSGSGQADEEIKEPIKEKVKLRAFVKCTGGNNSERRYTLSDSSDCFLAHTLYGGMTDCPVACLGLGSCASACKNQAISIKNGIAVVDAKVCNGCGSCLSFCPRSIIELIPANADIIVGCNRAENEFELDKICDTGCIGCASCVNNCEYGAIEMKNNIAVIDYEKCNSCGRCAAACPRGIISAPPKKSEETETFENEHIEVSEISR